MELSKEEWLRHAKFELELVNEVPELTEFYLKIVEVFWEYNHDERSLDFTPKTIQKLLTHTNLTGLTSSPDEWSDLGNGIWRNKRDANAYSVDSGRTKVMFPVLDTNMDYTLNAEGLPPRVLEKLEELKDI